MKAGVHRRGLKSTGQLIFLLAEIRNLSRNTCHQLSCILYFFKRVFCSSSFTCMGWGCGAEITREAFGRQYRIASATVFFFFFAYQVPGRFCTSRFFSGLPKLKSLRQVNPPPKAFVTAPWPRFLRDRELSFFQNTARMSKYIPGF